MRGVTRPRRRRWGAGTTSPPAITSGARASLSLSETRTSLLLAGGRRCSRPRGEATGDPDLPPRRRKAVPPALHLRKPGQSLGEPLHLTPPPAPFYRPLLDLPHPEAARPPPGGGQPNSDWQETTPPPRGLRPGQPSQPRLPHRLPGPMAPPLPVSSILSTLCCS